MAKPTRSVWLLTQPEGIITAPCLRPHYRDKIELYIIIFWLTLRLTAHIMIWKAAFTPQNNIFNFQSNIQVSSLD